MKLFVWNNPYQVNYGGSCLYVMANDLKEARKLAQDKCELANYGGFDSKELRVRNGINVSNVEPTRVYDAPHAEVYEWSE